MRAHPGCYSPTVFLPKPTHTNRSLMASHAGVGVQSPEQAWNVSSSKVMISLSPPSSSRSVHGEIARCGAGLERLACSVRSSRALIRRSRRRTACPRLPSRPHCSRARAGGQSVRPRDRHRAAARRRHDARPTTHRHAQRGHPPSAIQRFRHPISLAPTPLELPTLPSCACRSVRSSS